MRNLTISQRLVMMVSILIFLSCIFFITISIVLSHNALKNEIFSNTLPAKTADVVSSVNKILVFPSTILKTIAQSPFLIEWIENGEDPEKRNFIWDIQRNIQSRCTSDKVGLIIDQSLTYYQLENNQNSMRNINRETDGWFFAFKESGTPLYVNIHPPDDPHYPNQGFLDIRIQNDKGKFLGIVAIGMDVGEFIKRVGSTRIGEKGLTFLVRKNGEIMLHSVKKHNGSQLASLPGFENYASNILTSKGMTFETVDANGEDILVSTREIPILNAVVITIANASELFRPLDKIKIFSSLAGLVILIISFLLLTLFARTITRPMETIIAYADDVAAEREARTPPTFSVMELEKLRQALNRIVQSMSGRLEQIQQKGQEAEKALTHSKMALAEAEEAKHQAEEGRDRMRTTAEQLEHIASTVSSASEELSSQIEESNKGTEEQAHRISATASAMVEMNGAVLEVARNASQASELSDQARKKGQAGADVVKEAGDSMEELQRQTHALKADMSELDEHAGAITQVMSVISDIADQTNLLALNAAIEAARAGEAGRGFAVVADEVRKLAEKTMASTADVSRTITQIQESTAKNIQQVERTGHIVEEVAAKAQAASEALGEIVQLVDKNAEQIQSIATASEEQSATSEEINRSVTEVDAISNENSQAMREAAQAVVELSRQAHELHTLINELYKV